MVGLVFSVFAATSLASSGLDRAAGAGLRIKSSTGENLRLSEYRGDVVMINFWATWCGPCRQEMPLLDDLYTRYQRVGFNLLGVNIDDDSRRAMQMIEELGVNFPVLFDARKEVSKLYEVDAMPVTVSSIVRATCATSITATSRATKRSTSTKSAPAERVTYRTTGRREHR